MSQVQSNENNSVFCFRIDDLKSSPESSHYTSYSFKDLEGQGIARSVLFNSFFTVLELDAFLIKDVELKLFNSSSHLYFLYLKEGMVFHRFCEQHQAVKIEELSPTIVGSRAGEDNVLLIKNNRQTKLNLICVDKDKFYKDFRVDNENHHHKNTKLLEALEGLNSYLYVCSKNIRLSERFREIKKIGQPKDFINLIHLKSQYLSTVGEFLNQFYAELFLARNSTSLSLPELHSIKKLTEFIIDYPEIQHSIKNLCQRSGLSPSKLQEGFKSMHGQTVAHFIRQIRLKKAKSLFNTTDLNVSEVVYSIGITSRSYFCKIFKSYYGLSPSAYKNQSPTKKLT